MDWTKLLYVLIIVLLYVPMVFLGANVFFPKYTGDDAHFQGYEKCSPTRAPADAITGEEREANQECLDKAEEERKVFNAEKREYEGWKYVFVVAFNLIILLIALFITLQDSIVMGLFTGTVVAIFFSTIRYFDSNSKVGFGLLVVTFFVALFFINRRKGIFLKKKKKR